MNIYTANKYIPSFPPTARSLLSFRSANERLPSFGVFIVWILDDWREQKAISFWGEPQTNDWKSVDDAQERTI